MRLFQKDADQPQEKVPPPASETIIPPAPASGTGPGPKLISLSTEQLNILEHSGDPRGDRILKAIHAGQPADDGKPAPRTLGFSPIQPNPQANQTDEL